MFFTNRELIIFSVWKLKLKNKKNKIINSGSKYLWYIENCGFEIIKTKNNKILLKFNLKKFKMNKNETRTMQKNKYELSNRK